MSEDFKQVIWTDNEQTRALIWDAYVGFLEHYNNYMMYKSLEITNKITGAGLKRYANYFYEEIRCFLEILKIPKEHVELMDFLFNKDDWTTKDIVQIRRFFADFMYVSGIKQIIMTKDQRSNFDRLQSKYNLKIED